MVPEFSPLYFNLLDPHLRKSVHYAVATAAAKAMASQVSYGAKAAAPLFLIPNS